MIPLLFCLLNLESVEKKGKNIENEKSFLKAFFIVFTELLIGEKIKNSGHKLELLTKEKYFSLT